MKTLSPPTPHLSPLSAFTLTEMLVVMTIFGTIAGAVLMSFLIGQQSFKSIDASIHVQQQARQALQAMVAELREAGNIDSPATSPNVSFTNVSRINFQIARGYDTSACGGICWGDDAANGRWVHYLMRPASPTDTELVRCLSATSDSATFDSCRVLARNLDETVLPLPDGAPATAFTFTSSSKIIDLRVAVVYTSQQLPGGRVGSGPPEPIRAKVTLRN